MTTTDAQVSAITMGVVQRSRHVGAFVVTEAVHSGFAALQAHEHEYASLTLVLGGSFVERVDGRTWECGGGHIVAKPGGAKHANQYGPLGNREILIEARAPHPFTGKAFALAHLPRSPLPGIAEAIAAELRASDDASELVLHGSILQLLASVLRSGDVRERQQPNWIREVRDRLHSASEDVSLQALADGAKVHPVHLVRTFKRYFGLTPGAYLRTIRIERACERLRTSKESISRIAADAGFAHHAHFSRTFLAVTGQTPSAYRRAHHNQKR